MESGGLSSQKLSKITSLICCVIQQNNLATCKVHYKQSAGEFLHYLNSPSELLTQAAGGCPHPVHPSAAHPSLFARWAWREVGKQTADTLRYFLSLHQLSFPAAACRLDVRKEKKTLATSFSRCPPRRPW